MEIGRIQGANHNLGAPSDWDEARDGLCGVLPVLVHRTDEGQIAMSSAWLPTPNELHALATGGAIILRVLGQTHPVVSVGVSQPAEPSPDARYGAQLYDAWKASSEVVQIDVPFEKLKPEHRAFWDMTAGVFLQLVRELAAQ